MRKFSVLLIFFVMAFSSCIEPILDVQLSEPQYTPAGGVYSDPVDVYIIQTTKTVMYTIDGTDPSYDNGILYEGKPIIISNNTTLKSFQFQLNDSSQDLFSKNYLDSKIATAEYVFSESVANPTFSLPGGVYSTPTNISIFCSTPGASIRYTTDGSLPTEIHGTLYTGEILIGYNKTVKAIAYLPQFQNSAVISASYIIGQEVSAPVFSLPGGIYSNSQQIYLISGNSNATIRYSTDGSQVTITNGLIYNGGPIIIDQDTTIRAIAIDGYYHSDEVQSSYYIYTELIRNAFFTHNSGGSIPVDWLASSLGSTYLTSYGDRSGVVSFVKTVNGGIGIIQSNATALPLSSGKRLSLSFRIDSASLAGDGFVTVSPESPVHIVIKFVKAGSSPIYFNRYFNYTHDVDSASNPDFELVSQSEWITKVYSLGDMAVDETYKLESVLVRATGWSCSSYVDYIRFD